MTLTQQVNRYQKTLALKKQGMAHVFNIGSTATIGILNLSQDCNATYLNF